MLMGPPFRDVLLSAADCARETDYLYSCVQLYIAMIRRGDGMKGSSDLFEGVFKISARAAIYNIYIFEASIVFSRKSEICIQQVCVYLCAFRWHRLLLKLNPEIPA